MWKFLTPKNFNLRHFYSFEQLRLAVKDKTATNVS